MADTAMLPETVTADRFNASSLKAANDMTTEGDKLEKSYQTDRAPAAQAVSQSADALQTEVDKPVEKVAVPTNRPVRADPKQLQETASSMMALAGLAGLLTRRPLTAALNNMTAAMEGVKEGDDQRFKHESDMFEKNYKDALAQNKAALDEKEKVLKDRSLSLTARQQQLHLIDTKYGADVARNTKKFDEYMKLFDGQVKAQQHAQSALEKQQEFRQNYQMHRETLAETIRHHGVEEAHAADAGSHTGTLEYKLKELDRVGPEGSGLLSAEDVATRKKILIEGSSHPTMAEDKAALQSIPLRKAAGEIDTLSKSTKMPVLADIEIDGHGVASAYGRLGQKRALTAEEQQLVTAAQLFGESAGHLVSGSRVTKDAFARVVREFVPQPGDKPETLAMKKEHRDAIIDGASVASGRAGKQVEALEKKRADAKATAAPAGPYSDAEKEARYQKWKADHAGQ